MTLEEFSKKYNFSENTIKKNFKRVQEKIEKDTGVRIIKTGRGASASYMEEIVDDKRAKTMFEEDKELITLDYNSFKFVSWDFIVFLAIVTTPMLVFRGSYNDFLKYIEVKNSKDNIQKLKDTLVSLAENDYISYNIDKTNNDYFVAALYRKVEEDMSVGIGMVRRCKMIAEKHGKKSWVPLVKVWLGVGVLSEHQPYTVSELVDLTGLSEYQIREADKILRKENIYLKENAYYIFKDFDNKNIIRGTGSNVILNAFYNE